MSDCANIEKFKKLTDRDRELIEQVIENYQKALRRLRPWKGVTGIFSILAMSHASCPFCQAYEIKHFSHYCCGPCPAYACVFSPTVKNLVTAMSLVNNRYSKKRKQNVMKAIKARIKYWEDYLDCHRKAVPSDTTT